MHIRPGTWIGIVALVWAGVGYASAEPSLAFGALAWGSILFFLHRIEVKLNRLLDDRGITVRDTDD
ncbi:hypothetical protein [Aureimonas sp. AU4]|uniref:hypothetical protein n=1 Tax=Aureimonas sp. AU4 TaxID=1638163 RepID=UPI000784F763|nr:hypothetical protein [Aureimonas sp. AU4]